MNFIQLLLAIVKLSNFSILEGEYFVNLPYQTSLEMIQEIVVYGLLILALAYVGYRLYSSIKKKQACGKCALMEAAQKTTSK